MFSGLGWDLWCEVGERRLETWGEETGDLGIGDTRLLGDYLSVNITHCKADIVRLTVCPVDGGQLWIALLRRGGDWL